MSLVDRLKRTIRPERKDMYRCDDCGEPTYVDPDRPADECPACESSDLTLVTRRANV